MDELVKRLRAQAVYLPEKFSKNAELLDVLMKAADAIEELSKKYLDSEVDNTNLTGWLAEEHAKHLWIPVTEALPEHDKNVLICYEWTGRSRTVYREVGIASIEELERDPTEMFRPLYWMPLPEPPKEGRA